MGVTTSAASLPSEAAAPSDPPAKEVAPPAATADAGPQAAAAVDPPAKEAIQHGAATDSAPPESAAPADSPSKGEIQSAASADAAGGEAEARGETVILDADAAAAETSEEEEGECGFCLYMKGGGCKEEFVEWEKCIEAAEAEGESVDIVDRCANATTALRACMGKFPDYYEAILSVERAMSDDLDAAAKAEAEAGQASPTSPSAAEGEQGDNKKQPEEEVVILVDEKEDPAA